MLREYIWLACAHMRLVMSVTPMIVTPCSTTVCPGLVSAQLPCCSAARSTITLPAFIDATISAVTRTGARRPGMSAVHMTTSALATCRAMASACFLLESSLSSRA